MAYDKRLKYSAIREMDFSLITDIYQDLGSTLSVVPRIIKFINATDANIYLTIDDSTDGDKFPAGSGEIIDLMANNPVSDLVSSFPIGTQFGIKHDGSAPTKGYFAIVTIEPESGR